jgi:hypothetical protein
LKKYRYADFFKPRFSRAEYSIAPSVAKAVEGLHFAHWKWATSVFRRWSTEPLHPAF